MSILAQCNEVGSAGGWARSAVQLEDGDEHERKNSGDQEAAASEDREVPGVFCIVGERSCVLE